MHEEVVATKQEIQYPEEGYKEMVEAAVFWGRGKSRTHPRMRPYILTTRNGIEVINLAKTKEILEKALEFLKAKVRSGGTVFFVGTQPQAEGIAEVAHEFGFPVVTRRWLGGTLTNFRVIAKRIDYFKKLKSDWEANAFSQYTKKERLGIERELRRLEELVGGLENLKSLPEVLVVIDPKVHTTAIREARALRIPVITLINTDSDPDALDFPVVGNNKARLSVQWFLGRIREAIREAKLAPAEPVSEGAEAITSPDGKSH